MAVAPVRESSGGVPPHSLDAEASVLGTILLTEQALDLIQVRVGLKDVDFYRPRHQLIFRAMAALKDKTEPEAIDALTVCEHLKRMRSLEEAGGEPYVHSLPTLVPDAGNVIEYARIVHGHSMRRRLLDVTRTIQESVFHNGADPRELIDQAEHLLFEVGHEHGTGELRSIEDVLHDELDKLEKLSREGADLTGTPSGFLDIDEVTGGFQPGNLIVLAARPSMGKSALVTNMAENAAVEHGRAVAIFSLEMSETELAQRFIASQARVNGEDLRKGRVKADRWPKVLRATEKLAAAPMHIDDSSDIGIAEIRAKARRLHARHDGLGLLIVDYLQLMRPDGKTESRVEQIGQMSRGLKILARELEIPVIAVSQLSRAVEARPNKKPLLSDLRESGCLTGDSRVFLPETGDYQPISKLVGAEGLSVLSLNPETWRLEPRSVTRVFRTGRKTVYRLTTRLGRTIRATTTHKFLTIDGWRRLSELDGESVIALPRMLPDPAQTSKRMSHEELGLLGHLIGDGCTLPTHAIQYTTNDLTLADRVSKLAKSVFGDAVSPRTKRERQWYQVYLASTRRLTHRVRNPVAAWLDRLGAFGLRAREKHVPAEVFNQPREGVAIFLRHLWATDGTVWLGRKHRPSPAIYYSTSSPRLARDVQALLLRIGITATRSSITDDRDRTQFYVRVTGGPDVTAFIEQVGGLGAAKEQHARAISEWLTLHAPNTNRDVVPRSVWRSHVVPAMEARGLTTRQMQASLGGAYCGSTLYRSNLSRHRASAVAEVVGCEELGLLAHSDVYWDRVVDVVQDGEEDVFDMTVEGLHNFVADDIVVHNSIEQDADVVMFVYRDEYYTKEESERPGEADILIAKHRNGPIRDVVLTFQSRYPKFANFRSDGVTRS